MLKQDAPFFPESAARPGHATRSGIQGFRGAINSQNSNKAHVTIRASDPGHTQQASNNLYFNSKGGIA